MDASAYGPQSVARLALNKSPARRILEAAIRAPGFKVGMGILLLLLIAMAFYPLLSDVSATTIDVRARFLPPIGVGDKWTWTHPLGTDQLGRDILMRSVVGLRYSLFIGVASVCMMLMLGCGLGIYAGYRAGWRDTVIMRITDAQLSIPMIILAISILGVSTPTVQSIILVLAMSGWPLYARVARSVALAERSMEYVRGLEVLGAGHWRIMLLYMVPTILPPIVFIAVLDVARMMIFETILGFLGLGVPPPAPSFGTMISDGRKYLINAWWIASCPGMFLALALLSLNLIGASFERARNNVFGGFDGGQ
jgi:peptide/nickel transport system permease protein